MWRLRILLVFFYGWFFLIAARLFYWQVLSSGELSQIAAKQHLMRLEVLANRGEIVSSEGYPIVSNKHAYLVYAEPKKIIDKKTTTEKLSQKLSVDEASISGQLNSELFWVPLKHKVDQEIVDALRELKLVGVGFEIENKRYYPEGSMSAQLVGFVGSAFDGNPRGYFGLEGYYDRQLRGRVGFLQQAKSASGNPILAGETQRIPPQDGSTLKLHLDRTVQFIIEKKLREGLEKYQAKGGTIIVLNPKNGGILAMASEPSFDPSVYSDYTQDRYKNLAISGVYEPGSTFKTIVMAAALEENVVKPDTIFEEKGPIPVGGYFIRTWNNKYNGTVTATEILEKSSNVGMVQIEKLMGGEKLLSYIKKFGFGLETGVDLDSEESPALRLDNEWKEIDYATLSFGQGIAVTPLQMVRAVSVLANGGKLFEPHVVASIISPTGETFDIKPKLVAEIITPVTASVITEMMVQAVDKGEAKFAKPKGYRVAGKTGTAQIPVAGHYDSEKTIASFVGFAPADDPKFVMLVTLREPTTSPWGSETAAPLFFSIAKELFSYYAIPPSS